MVMDVETILRITQDDLDNSEQEKLRGKSINIIYRAARKRLYKNPYNVCYGTENNVSVFVDSGPTFDEEAIWEREYGDLWKQAIRSSAFYALRLKENHIELEITHEKGKFPFAGLEVAGMYDFKIISQEPIETEQAA